MRSDAFIARRVAAIGDAVQQSLEQAHGHRMLTLAEVARTLRYKADTSFRKQRARLERDQGFPLPVKRGNRLLWDAHQVEAWVQIQTARQKKGGAA